MTGITTKNLILRRPTPADWPAWRAYYATDRSAGNGGPRHEGLAWRGFAGLLGHWQFHDIGLWAVTRKNDDTAIAMIGAFYPADWPEREIGWMILSTDAEGKGVAYEAATAAIAHAYDVWNWPTAVSYITPGNTRSIALAERLGAHLDPNAQCPRPENPCLVYHHPQPKGLT